MVARKAALTLLNILNIEIIIGDMSRGKMVGASWLVQPTCPLATEQTVTGLQRFCMERQLSLVF